MKRIELVDQKKTEVSQYGNEITKFIYQRYVVVAPTNGSAYVQVRKVEVTRLKNDEGKYEFDIAYLGVNGMMITPLGSYSRNDNTPSISEIEAFCGGVDATLENIFDKLDSYLPNKKVDEIHDSFWEQLKKKELINQKN